MKAKKFELFMGCLGNGTTLCNKAVEEHGDYKKIGHISDRGHIKLYVSEDYIPEADMQRIKAVAEQDKQRYMDYWNGLTEAEKYSRLLDELPWKIIRPYMMDKLKTAKQTIEELTEAYMNLH